MLAAILYTYFVYPLVVFAMVKLRGPLPERRAAGGVPTVSMVVAVYNEAAVIEEKLKNLTLSKYPQENIEFLFGSDGSTDRTNEILARSVVPGLRFSPFGTRRGKVAVLNELIANARGEIIVFSDANTFYAENTVQQLVDHFADPAIGGVCGKLVLKPDPEALGGKGESSYWEYENWLKHLESDYYTILGATGGVYAIRKRLYKPLPTIRSVTDDFVIPLNVVQQGFRVKYVASALAFEKTADSIAGEFRRKARIGAQNFNSIREFAPLLSPRSGFVSFALWSHKMLRWGVPFLGAVMVMTSFMLALHADLYRLILLGEGLFLAVALIGLLAEKKRFSMGVLSLPYYLVAMNTALFVGFVKFLFRRQQSTWEVVR